LGISHHSTEDIAIMRALPNMVVLAPCDPIEVAAVTKLMMDYAGPVYLRCGYKGEPDIVGKPFEAKLGGSSLIRDGKDATLFFAGTVGINAVKAVEELAKEGINCRLVSLYSIKPIDKDAIISAAKETKGIVVLEEHNICGGVGSAVAEVLMDNGAGNVPFKRVAMPDVNATKVGCQAWMREQYGLGVNDVINAVKEVIK
ncbi:MAG: transketolase family protein, partial [Lentisphaeria bacterium]|nr:transketolase family protein [Lentisphaeria bacterium]